MKKIVAGKKPRRGKAAEPEAAEPTGDNVVSIMDALKRSVAGGRGERVRRRSAGFQRFTRIRGVWKAYGIRMQSIWHLK